MKNIICYLILALLSTTQAVAHISDAATLALVGKATTMANAGDAATLAYVGDAISYTNADDSKDDGIELFAVASLSTGDKEVYLGDSVIVTITVYSNVQFSQIKNKSDNAPSIKNSTVHYYNRNRRLSQGTAIYNNKRYYAVAAQQFAVTPSETTTLTFPTQKYNVELAVQIRNRGYDPFEEFFSFGNPFGNTRTEKIQKTCASEPIKIKVIKRPPKTIEELRRSGAVVM